MVGVVEESPGLAHAREMGLKTTAEGGRYAANHGWRRCANRFLYHLCLCSRRKLSQSEWERRPDDRLFMEDFMKKIQAGMTACLFMVLPVNVYLADQSVTPGFNQKIPEEIMTADSVDTRIGELNFYDGIPTAETLDKVYDNLDFIRGVDVFLNFITPSHVYWGYSYRL